MNSVWAVAKNTIRQALRMKIAIIFIVLLAILLPVMGFTIKGDGTLKGKLQTFISYGLSLTTFMLSILTIIISIYTLTSDIKQKQIFTVITKPIRRFQLIFGKLLGVVLLDLILIIPLFAILYGLTIAIPRFSNASLSELEQVKNEFFTARRYLTPQEPDVENEVRQTYENLEKSGQIEQYFRGSTKQGIFAELRHTLKLQKRAAPPGYELTWQFNKVRPAEPNANIFIKFKYDVSRNPPDMKIFGKWFVGDDRQLKYATGIKTPIYAIERQDLIRTVYEIEIPSDAVADDGYVSITFQNDPQFNSAVVIFPFEDGLELLYKNDSFTANYIRSVFIIFFRLLFLACLGTLAATFLTFPVAILFCFAIFFVGSISGFALESFDSLTKNVAAVYTYTIKLFVLLLPHLDEFDPNKFLIPARLLSWPLVLEYFGSLVCVRAGVIIILALIFFHRKELAKITV